jgi:hypothetical protein
MEMGIRIAIDAAAEITATTYPKIRLVRILRHVATSPQDVAAAPFPSFSDKKD